MQVILLKSKIHRAMVTDANLHYEGSISIDPALCKAAKFHEFEKVDIFNINNGDRFSTYVMMGKQGEIGLNGAAARRGQKRDRLIIVSYMNCNEQEAKDHQPTIVTVNQDNKIQSIRTSSL